MSILAALGIILSGAVGVLFTVQWAFAARLACGSRGRGRRSRPGFVAADLAELGRRLALVEVSFVTNRDGLSSRMYDVRYRT